MPFRKNFEISSPLLEIPGRGSSQTLEILVFSPRKLPRLTRKNRQGITCTVCEIFNRPEFPASELCTLHKPATLLGTTAQVLVDAQKRHRWQTLSMLPVDCCRMTRNCCMLPLAMGPTASLVLG